MSLQASSHVDIAAHEQTEAAAASDIGSALGSVQTDALYELELATQRRVGGQRRSDSRRLP